MIINRVISKITCHIVFVMLLSCSFFYDPFPLNTIQIYSPFYGYEIKTGDKLHIKWESRGTGKYLRIDLYDDNLIIETIDDSTSNSKEYIWIIPGYLKHSEKYQLKITDVADTNIFCYSDEFLIYSNVVFPDSNLSQFMLNQFPEADQITTKQLVTIKELDIHSKNIWNLEGIRYCSNLENLDLGNNHFYSINDLKYLNALTILDISDNQNISSYTPLFYLTTIQELDISHNQVNNLAFLVKSDSLRRLSAGSCQLKNIIDIQNKPLLEYINLIDNNITNIHSLATVVNISTLLLNNNKIIDIEPLMDNPGLSTGDIVMLSNNPLNDISINEYIPELINRGVNIIY